ncbi:MAG TPA: antitoxin Xre/MbcA/ParS toxin-binding domain-containing protein [Chthoniobacterales bacterium]
MSEILEGTKKETQLIELQSRIAELQQQLQSILGSGGLRLILPDLHAENGRIDAQKVADYIGIPLKRLSDGIGLRYGSVHRNPSSESLQDALWPVKRTLELLYEFFGRRETIRVWLNTPHPDLGGKTALEIILENKAVAVQTILENAFVGVPS